MPYLYLLLGIPPVDPGFDGSISPYTIYTHKRVTYRYPSGLSCILSIFIYTDSYE